jgi:hypothetical protein
MNIDVKYSIDTENGDTRKKYSGTVTIEDDGTERPVTPAIIHGILKHLTATPKGRPLLTAKRVTLHIAIP